VEITSEILPAAFINCRFIAWPMLVRKTNLKFLVDVYMVHIISNLAVKLLIIFTFVPVQYQWVE
jgi:hypothetical protein